MPEVPAAFVPPWPAWPPALPPDAVLLPPVPAVPPDPLPAPPLFVLCDSSPLPQATSKLVAAIVNRVNACDLASRNNVSSG